MKTIQAFLVKNYPPIVLSIMTAVIFFVMCVVFALIESIVPDLPAHLR